MEQADGERLARELERICAECRRADMWSEDAGDDLVMRAAAAAALRSSAQKDGEQGTKCVKCGIPAHCEGPSSTGECCGFGCENGHCVRPSSAPVTPEERVERVEGIAMRSSNGRWWSFHNWPDRDPEQHTVPATLLIPAQPVAQEGKEADELVCVCGHGLDRHPHVEPYRCKDCSCSQWHNAALRPAQPAQPVAWICEGCGSTEAERVAYTHLVQGFCVDCRDAGHHRKGAGSGESLNGEPTEERGVVGAGDDAKAIRLDAESQSAPLVNASSSARTPLAFVTQDGLDVLLKGGSATAKGRSGIRDFDIPLYRTAPPAPSELDEDAVERVWRWWDEEQVVMYMCRYEDRFKDVRRLLTECRLASHPTPKLTREDAWTVAYGALCRAHAAGFAHGTGGSPFPDWPGAPAEADRLLSELFPAKGDAHG